MFVWFPRVKPFISCEDCYLRSPYKSSGNTRKHTISPKASHFWIVTEAHASNSSCAFIAATILWSSLPSRFCSEIVRLFDQNDLLVSYWGSHSGRSWPVGSNVVVDNLATAPLRHFLRGLHWSNTQSSFAPIPSDPRYFWLSCCYVSQVIPLVLRTQHCHQCLCNS